MPSLYISACKDYHLGVKAYGVKEFGVQDADDHDIGFGQILGR